NFDQTGNYTSVNSNSFISVHSSWSVGFFGGNAITKHLTIAVASSRIATVGVIACSESYSG
ncbi:hypothetical protein, partial [Nioella sp.]|uniref:hypothetical protein n=1 Tax=Nioella sp. TaxID=1912091 RepID=UPI00351579EB